MPGLATLKAISEAASHCTSDLSSSKTMVMQLIHFLIITAEELERVGPQKTSNSLASQSIDAGALGLSLGAGRPGVKEAERD